MRWRVVEDQLCFSLLVGLLGPLRREQRRGERPERRQQGRLARHRRRVKVGRRRCWTRVWEEPKGVLLLLLLLPKVKV